MRGWKKISEFPEAEQNKLRWIVRHARHNGLVESGAAVRYGHAWLINEAKLAGFLQKQTLQALGKEAVA